MFHLAPIVKFTFDPAGWMIRREDPKGETVTFTHTMAGTSTAWDGVMCSQTTRPATLSSPALNLEWNFDNQLIGADVNGSSGSLEVTFEYDALGRRVSRSHSSGNVVYVHAGQQVIADYARGTAASTPTYRYVYADYVDEPILRHAGTGSTLPGSGDNALSYHRNQQYSIVALTNAAGTLVERYTYTAYGTLGIHAANGTVRTSSTYTNRYTYTGREWDAELKLYHFRARWYDPTTGGFISRDPLGYVDGMSLYRGYFGVSGVEPSGLLSIVQDTVPPADPKTGRVSKPPVFGKTRETMGVLDPRTQYPDAGVIANFWGEKEAKNVDDYYVIGCPDLDKYGDEVIGSLTTGEVIKRRPTSDLADRSVDIILIRASPFRCCELREVCRLCRDGCLVIYTFADFPRQDRPGLTMPADQIGLWDLTKDCIGDRFGVGGLVRPRYTANREDGTTVEIEYWGFWFTLKAGDCPRESEGEGQQCS